MPLRPPHHGLDQCRAREVATADRFTEDTAVLCTPLYTPPPYARPCPPDGPHSAPVLRVVHIVFLNCFILLLSFFLSNIAKFKFKFSKQSIIRGD